MPPGAPVQAERRHALKLCLCPPPRAPPPRRLAETGMQRPPRVAQRGGKPPDGHSELTPRGGSPRTDSELTPRGRKPPDGHSELTPRGGKPPDGLSELTPRGRRPPDRLRADSPAGPLGCCALRVTLSPGPRCPRGAAQTLGGPGRGVSPAAAPPGFRLQETAGDGGDAFGIWSPAHASI